MCMYVVTYGVQPWVICGLSSIACVLIRLALPCAAVGYSSAELVCTCAVTYGVHYVSVSPTVCGRG